MASEKDIKGFIYQFEVSAAERDCYDFLKENAPNMIAHSRNRLECVLRSILDQVCSNEDFDADAIRTQILEVLGND